MVICPYCGSENADENKFCDNCGAPLKEQRSEAANLESTVPNESSEDPYGSAEDDSLSSNDQPYQDNAQNDGSPAYISTTQMVEPIPTGGLVVWAAIVLLLCTIPGAVAFYFIAKINQNKLKDYRYLKKSEYEEFLKNHKVMEPTKIDYEKLCVYAHQKESLNPHEVNPFYVKKIEVEQ